MISPADDLRLRAPNLMVPLRVHLKPSLPLDHRYDTVRYTTYLCLDRPNLVRKLNMSQSCSYVSIDCVRAGNYVRMYDPNPHT